MIETTKETITLEEVEAVEIADVVKPYTFRDLGAPDIFVMTKIIKKIGVKEFKACFEGDGIQGLILESVKNAKENGENPDFISVGVGVALDIADVILGNLHLCEDDIYRLLAQTSNLSIETIKAPGNAVMFVEMLIDFIKKEEFRDFFKAVSKLF